jgi:hypothetical protein
MFKAWIDRAHDVQYGMCFVDPDSNDRREWTFTGCLLMAVYYEARHFVEATICRYRGHDIEMSSVIGPDSGYEVWHCERCGIGGSHAYY